MKISGALTSCTEKLHCQIKEKYKVLQYFIESSVTLQVYSQQEQPPLPSSLLFFLMSIEPFVLDLWGAPPLPSKRCMICSATNVNASLTPVFALALVTIKSILFCSANSFPV